MSNTTPPPQPGAGPPFTPTPLTTPLAPPPSSPSTGEESDPHLNKLYDNLKYSEEEFDKTLLYVSSGMLAISPLFCRHAHSFHQIFIV